MKMKVILKGFREKGDESKMSFETLDPAVLEAGSTSKLSHHVSP